MGCGILPVLWPKMSCGMLFVIISRWKMCQGALVPRLFVLACGVQPQLIVRSSATSDDDRGPVSNRKMATADLTSCSSKPPAVFTPLDLARTCRIVSPRLHHFATSATCRPNEIANPRTTTEYLRKWPSELSMLTRLRTPRNPSRNMIILSTRLVADPGG